MGNTYSIHFSLPVLVIFVLASSVAHGAQNLVGYPFLIEMFTTVDQLVTGKHAIRQQQDYRKIELYVYKLDGIQRIEAKLSKGLTAGPDRSKRIILKRIHQLDEASRLQMQHAAMGLAKAVQYGIDRYPAIVFDGQVVVYGVTDVQAALAHYQAWRQEDKR